MEQERQKRETEKGEFQSVDISVLCANDCGFFGSAATNNLCSKCYRDYFLNKSKASMETIVVPPPPEPKTVHEQAAVDSVVASSMSSSEEGAASGENPLPKKDSGRCRFCNKKVGLMGFKCRCGEVFCSTHRYSDKHNCVFDYRAAAQDAIAMANPVVKTDKLEKI